jgi:hypothetical protein
MIMAKSTRTRTLLLTLLLASHAGITEAQKKGYLPESPTANEMRALPPYCEARMKGDAAAKKSWSQQMGPEIFMHVHHYCAGINFMNRSRVEMAPQKKNYYLQRASANFAYVISAWPPGHPLTAKAKSFKAQIESMRSMH